MGKLDVDPIIRHFSHQHPLELSNLQLLTQSTVLCSGCGLKASGWIYSCKTCNYYLHKSCSQMPQEIKHPVDPNHTLTLFSSPVYPEGVFSCNACGRPGTAFCFHCKECELDIHLLCASMPFSVIHGSHDHPLKLAFFAPYDDKGFSCDICRGSGSNNWLYRCNLCEFDAHMGCAIVNSQSHVSINDQHLHQQLQELQVNFQSNPPQIPIRGIGLANGYQEVNQVNCHSQQMKVPSLGSQFQSPGIGLPYGFQQLNQGNYYESTRSLGVHRFGQHPGMSITGSGLAGCVRQGVLDGFAQQIGQTMAQGMFGGSGSSSGIDIGSAILNTILNN